MKVPEDFPITGKYDVVCCSKCGFIYADINDTQRSYNKYYADYNMYSSVSKIKKEIYEKASNQKVDFLEKFICKTDKVIDIGCGGGDLLKGLRKKGYRNLYGIDPSLKSVEILQSEGIAGSVGNLFDEVPEKLKGKFDMVCCTAVLEHIYDLKGAVEKLSGYIKPESGKLFIDVPAIEGFAKYKANLSNNFNHEHINYFSLQSLDNLLGNKNLRRISKESESFYLFETEKITSELEIRGVYQFHEKNYNIVKDIQSVKAVKKYFEYIEEENGKRKELLKQVISRRKEIIIWGTGAFTQWILQNIPEIQNVVTCFIDNNIEKQGTRLCGKTIYSADYLIHRVITQGNSPLVLICSMQNSKEIAEQIEEMNINLEYFIVE